MQMEELRKQWITSEKEYREGEFLYTGRNLRLHRSKSCVYGTALGVYEAELNGTKIGEADVCAGIFLLSETCASSE